MFSTPHINNKDRLRLSSCLLSLSLCIGSCRSPVWDSVCAACCVNADGLVGQQEGTLRALSERGWARCGDRSQGRLASTRGFGVPFGFPRDLGLSRLSLDSGSGGCAECRKFVGCGWDATVCTECCGRIIQYQLTHSTMCPCRRGTGLAHLAQPLECEDSGVWLQEAVTQVTAKWATWACCIVTLRTTALLPLHALHTHTVTLRRSTSVADCINEAPSLLSCTCSVHLCQIASPSLPLHSRLSPAPALLGNSVPPACLPAPVRCISRPPRAGRRSTAAGSVCGVFPSPQQPPLCRHRRLLLLVRFSC